MVYSWQLKSYLHLGQYHNFQDPINRQNFCSWTGKCQTLLFPKQLKPGCVHQPGRNGWKPHIWYMSELSPTLKEQALIVFSGSTSEKCDTNYSFKRIQGSCNVPESRQPKSEDFTQGNFPSGAQECFKSDHIIWWSV